MITRVLIWQPVILAASLIVLLMPPTCDAGNLSDISGTLCLNMDGEMRERFPRERQDYERVGFEYVIPGGESARQRLERSVRVLTRIAEHHQQEAVVAVTHGGFLMGVFEAALGIPPGNGWRFKRHNGSYSVFEYSNGRWSLEVWNDTGHLDGAETLDDPAIQTT